MIISKTEFEVIAGTYIALDFYQSHRSEYPVALDLVRGLMDGITEDDLSKFQNAADEAAKVSMQAIDEAVIEWKRIAGDRPMPTDEEQTTVIKQVAFAHGMQVFHDAREMTVSDNVYRFLSMWGTHVLWKSVRPTQDVLSAIFLEGLAMALLGYQMWQMAKDEPMGHMVTATITNKFVVAGDEITIQFPTL